MAMLEVNNLSIQFGGLRAVDGFNMTIEKGQLYGLIGPNGAGKTTVFNLLTGVYKPTEGIIRLDGQDITGKSTIEPFVKLFNQGMITGKNGIKMSKSKGNVISPDDLVNDYGCDSLRMYELFVGPPELDAEWDDRGIDGVSRFLKRFWNLALDSIEKDIPATKEMEKTRHKMVYDITSRLEAFSLNTVVSGFMEYTNKLIAIAKQNDGAVDKETIETVTILLAPFVPHIAEEIWEKLGHEDSVFHAQWPAHDEELMKDDEIEVPVQINGKTKAVISIPAEISKEDAIAEGKKAVADKISGNIIKEIYVPKKIINIVVK